MRISTARHFVPGFKWRHVNLANFIESVRTTATSINPDFAVIVENFPMDYMDATKAGLDATAFASSENLVHVWETDSVSNTRAMSWSTPEDFRNKIAMLKWGKGISRDNASLSFSYGYQPLDAGLSMAATVATNNVPFEAKTPDMILTVDEAFRTNWFGYVKDHTEALLSTPRTPNVGIWYSAPTRDFQDFPTGGEYGMFANTVAPTTDPDWWSTDSRDSVVSKPHLGGYRGLSGALINMNIPYKVVADPGDPATQINGLDILLLPSVSAISDASAEIIRQYIDDGGVVLATGITPGSMDEFGNPRASNVFADLFNFNGVSDRRVNTLGSGLAIYRPDIIGTTLFGDVGDQVIADTAFSELEQLVRIHADEVVSLENGENVFLDYAAKDSTLHHLYLVNYSGLQQPVVPAPKTVTVHFRPPSGNRLLTAEVSSPDSNGQNGFSEVIDEGHGVYRFDVTIDQFSLINLTLEPLTQPEPQPFEGPVFADPAHQEAAESGLAFVLDSMRNASLPEPYNFGVHTNLLDNTDATDVYTNGHHVTAEHMGLLLRTSACMKNETAFDEAFRYVSEAMFSPLYHVPNWSIDKNAQRPFIEFNDDHELWLNANAPLDDMRVIRGLMDGYEKLGRQDAEVLANTMLEGVYWTTVTDRKKSSTLSFPDYPGGLLGFAWDWSEVSDSALTPPSVATGQGFLTQDLIPVDYQDLATIGHAAERDHRWRSVLNSTTQLLLDSEISQSGLFYNGLEQTGAFTGDFEYQGEIQGQHLKTIQVLWTAIHLARVSKFDVTLLNDTMRAQALDAATRSLQFFKTFYSTNTRVPEYLKFDGSDVDDCVNNQPADCLVRGETNLFSGEARIYAQISRLAKLLDDDTFANSIIDEKIITDRISNTTDPLYGLIGKSTTGTGDAEAWNILESVFSLCLNSSPDNTTPPTNGNNSVPVAVDDSVQTKEATPLVLTASQLLANDTDPDSDTLSVVSLASRGSNGGRIIRTGTTTWQYLPANGFSGAESLAYTISDGNGGVSHASINATVIAIPVATFLASDITVTSGTFDFGTLQSLTTDDTDTYDINSTTTTTGTEVTWIAKQTATEPEKATRLQLTYSGHYSQPDVTQTTSLYNYATSVWVEYDSRIVGDEVDSIVALDVTSNARDFIDSNGEMQVRIRGVRASGNFAVWANSLQWKISYEIEGSNSAPVVTNQAITTRSNTPVVVSLGGSDADGDNITLAVVRSPASGSLSGTIPDLTYTPNNGFTGADSFTFSANDGQLDSAEATVAITITDGNTRPVVTNASYRIIQNSVIEITLSGSDADTDALTYTIVNAPTNGTLSGLPPAITYTPALDFTGDDSFTFKANDGTIDSENATVLITTAPTPPDGSISNTGNALTLDGDLTDWRNYTSFGSDPDDVSGTGNPLDWLEAWLAHDSSQFFLAYRNDGDVSISWGQTLYIDTDGNPATGYQQGLPIGADYVIQGQFIYRYAGASDGSTWLWTYIAEMTGASSGGQFEYRFDKSALGNPAALQIAFVGSNEAYNGGTIEDTYPDGVYNSSSTRRFFSYSALRLANSPPISSNQTTSVIEGQTVEIQLTATDADSDPVTYSIIDQPANGTLQGTPPTLAYTPDTSFTGPDSFTFRATDGTASSGLATVSIIVRSAAVSAIPSNPVTTITLDGNLQEWATLQSFDDDPADITGNDNPVDYLSATMAHDPSNFYIAYTNDGGNLSTMPDWGFNVYIDSDNSTATGYKISNSLGADYLQQGASLYQYTGTGTSWSWADTGLAQRATAASSAEVAISRSAMNNPETLSIAIIGDNLSLGGGVEDYYPDGIYNTTSTVRFFNYTTDGMPSSPATIAPAFGANASPESGRIEFLSNARQPSRHADNQIVSVGGGSAGLTLMALWLMALLVNRRLAARRR
ncbi:hypothetical protein AB833_10735 [Chromatiales bacterium (ex Bugula neritina AB1)]|nr:hypothetical protein AB833_10735 [Chromatiales bacterium (ex Bugula neritina AB1)]